MSPRPRILSDADILEATARAVGRLGPHKLTLAEVAKDAGVSAATLIQRFGSKRGLLLAFARQAGSMLSDELDAARAAHASPLDAIMAVSLAQTRFISSPEALSNHVAFLQMDLNDSEFRALAASGAKRAQRELRVLLDEAVELGELARCDTSNLARAMQATFNGSIVFWAIHRKGKAETWVRRDLETLLSPYRRSPKTKRRQS